ncbi:hypothetical protein AJ79_04319 [Helicocarpus griseus UAMH5409]|uniref:Protein kinase domain-containing protein n=1 Tax=Helicocarpus griseus UAMH5409 TaxID=1447875 RepID=A0A2B7XUD3_9EURO|nr:hypothetical protein AJ79_04319 [Helicocarpus griseus UAMH5409]
MQHRITGKKYDPLHSNHEQDDSDPFLVADRAYTHETAAYVKLAELQGGLIPKYYGSFSLSLSTDGAKSRDVRLILLEIVHGTRTMDLDPSKFTQPERQAIMKAVIDAESTIYTHDVAHGDIHPRNVIFAFLPPFGQARNIVVVDFGISCVNSSGSRMGEEFPLRGTNISVTAAD